MRVVVIGEHGGPDVMRVEERPDPGAPPRPVRIDVQAAGVNFADTMARTGLYPDAPKPPMVVGYEVAGTVEKAGPGVTAFAPGARVVALTRFKGQASHVVAAASHVFPMPERMSFDEAAALPVNYVTAFHLVYHVG